MEIDEKMGVFADIFNACTDIEILYSEKSKNPIKNFFDNMNLSRAYKKIYAQINLIDTNPVIPTILFYGYLDCLGSSRSSFGSCRKIFKNREHYIATFETKVTDTMTAVIDVSQVSNGAFGNLISTNFHILTDNKEVYNFSIGYDEMVARREDEVIFDKDFPNANQEQKNYIARMETLAINAFKSSIKEDIYLFLKEFVDISKNRLERKRGINEKLR